MRNIYYLHTRLLPFLLGLFIVTNVEARNDELFDCSSSVIAPYQNYQGQLSVTLEQTRQVFQDIFNNYHDLKHGNKLKQLFLDFFGSYSPFFDQVIYHRLLFTKNFLGELTVKAFHSIDWAASCHPNLDFREYGLPDDLHNLHGAVNYYGLQRVDDTNFIDDRNIYLGNLFFKKPDMRVITLLHETSHLIGFPEEDIKNNQELSTLSRFVMTQDLFLNPKDPNSIEDAYVWEKFLLRLRGQKKSAWHLNNTINN